ncbi:3'-5' exonuclease [Luteococcus sp. Sow4_B9]|uniref:3'-5' exonuclease n=1 Tax=Luteococcus sp. Sow4_B9 TaxID=3438792 RepID=UPI003F963728
MSNLIMTKQGNRLDGSIKQKAFTFLEKLTTDDTAPGLHIEPINNSADPRVRTGRVDQQYRAVLFKLTSGNDTTYVFHGIWNHDEAIAVAQKTVLSLNPINGMPEIRDVEVERAEAGLPPIVDPASAMAHDPAAPASDREVAADTPETAPFRIHATAQELVGVLGLPKRLADQAVDAKSEEALLALQCDGPEWQQLALVGLASGMSVTEILEDLGSPVAAATPSTAVSDEALLERLTHPSARMEFAPIDGMEELRRVIESGDFGAWRVFLHPEQSKWATKRNNGSFRLSGGAGTGKTVVVLHRAKMLVDQSPRARVVVTTYTVNLANALSRDLRRLDPSIHQAQALGEAGAYIGGIDAIARQVLRGAGAALASAVAAVLGISRGELGQPTPNDGWRQAIRESGADLPVALKSARFFEAEYALVVLPNRITNLESYLRVRRPGRGVRLNRAERTQVWRVVEAYRRNSYMAGTLDFQEVATIAAVHLETVAANSGGRVADHVLVDEGQDMTPAHWQLLRALVAEGPDDLFIAEDSHQRIYGNKITLKHFGISVQGRSRRLTLNYRTTAQNLHYAVSILDGGEYQDLESEAESTAGYRSARTGPRPVLRGLASLPDELDFAAETIRRWIKDLDGAQLETIAVLVRDSRQRDLVVAGLAERGVSARAVDRDQPKAGAPVVMTMHRAKGSEFTRVLLFGVSKGSIPINLRDFDYSPDELQDALLRERSLLYVAASRARDELVVTWSGEASELTPQ